MKVIDKNTGKNIGKLIENVANISQHMKQPTGCADNWMY